jgi:RNA methyltransferase, TrmH family
MERISSRSNPKVKDVRALRQRKTRQERGLFLVEGIRHVGEAVDAGALLDSIFFASELLTSDYARELVRTQAERGVPCYEITAEVFDSLADKENPQGILAVARIAEKRLSDLSGENFPWGVALVSPQDPGNVGAILRTLDAVGARGMLLLESSVDLYHPGTVRASMGTLFWHPVVHATFDEFADWAQQAGYHIYGTSAHGAVDYRSVTHYERPCILLLGSERQGLTAGQTAVCEKLISMPMRGRVTSLNLAVAAGVMLYAMLENG